MSSQLYQNDILDCMMLEYATEWHDYQLLDTGNGKRLERFGKYVLVRPDPQILWKPRLEESVWNRADAVFDGDNNRWVIHTEIPEKWLLQYHDVKFWAKLTPFKHTGMFPEQTAQWDWMKTKIQQQDRSLSILNLFAYTGIASLVAAASGAVVTHVDASRPTIGWAKDNQAASNLTEKPIRWILDDAVTFVGREIKRGVRYDGIIMDPPVYGHGPNGEPWNFQKDFPLLLAHCQKVLSETPVFIIINAYAISSSALMLENVLREVVEHKQGIIESGELIIKEQSGQRLLSTGIFGRWSAA